MFSIFVTLFRYSVLVLPEKKVGTKDMDLCDIYSKCL